MPQRDAWEREYRNPQLISLGDKPKSDFLRFLRFLRKKEGLPTTELTILDLGAGAGRNANYLAELGNNVIGLEISQAARELAETRAKEKNVRVESRAGDIGASHPFESEYFDLIIDILASNSLNEKEREVYLKEVVRVLKPGGHFFVQALSKDGDKNAKKLLEEYPGPEKDTYVMPELGLIERVFSEEDFRNLYGSYFEIQQLTKKKNYALFKGQRYKRNYWIAYLKKV